MLDNKCDEDYPCLLEWAIEHDDGLSEEIMPVVAQCYQVGAAKGMPTALLSLGECLLTGSLAHEEGIRVNYRDGMELSSVSRMLNANENLLILIA